MGAGYLHLEVSGNWNRSQPCVPGCASEARLTTARRGRCSPADDVGCIAGRVRVGTISPVLLLCGSTLAGVLGAISIKSYADTARTMVLIAGFCAYFLSNGLLIEALRQNVSLSSAITVSACLSIILTSAAAIVFQGEQPSVRIITAMGFAIVALWLAASR